MTPQIAKAISANASENNQLVQVERIVHRAYEKIRSDAATGNFLSLVDTADLNGNKAVFIGAIRRLIGEGFTVGAYSRGMGHFFVDWNTTNKGFSAEAIEDDLSQ